MFQKACSKIRNSVYGIIGTSQVDKKGITCSNGTAFMIAPSILVTAAHLIHVENDPQKAVHQTFEVIRAPDIGQKMEKANLIAEDSFRDVALLQIDNPRSSYCVTLEPSPVLIGTRCGSLGFPLATVNFAKTGKMFNLVERFQGANISAFVTPVNLLGQKHSFYETDSLMYRGSSGCPGFLANSKVFSMHNKAVIESQKAKPNSPTNIQPQSETRLAISIWVPSIDIINFARDNEIVLRKRSCIFIFAKKPKQNPRK